jgi:hypothetical protein
MIAGAEGLHIPAVAAINVQTLIFRWKNRRGLAAGYEDFPSATASSSLLKIFGTMTASPKHSNGAALLAQSTPRDGSTRAAAALMPNPACIRFGKVLTSAPGAQ